MLEVIIAFLLLGFCGLVVLLVRTFVKQAKDQAKAECEGAIDDFLRWHEKDIRRAREEADEKLRKKHASLRRETEALYARLRSHWDFDVFDPQDGQLKDMRALPIPSKLPPDIG
ncbi:MAG: hypothetical protein Q8P45_02325 [Candidatus Harrisonbacteria bacterium]|nr:hypothetical protein [Candidatus Harrisonbacteria bacterium]